MYQKVYNIVLPFVLQSLTVVAIAIFFFQYFEISMDYYMTFLNNLESLLSGFVWLGFENWIMGINIVVISYVCSSIISLFWFNSLYLVGCVLTICFFLAQFYFMYIYLTICLLYALIGLLIVYIEYFIAFLTKHGARNLQYWDAIPHSGIKATMVISLGYLVFYFLPLVCIHVKGLLFIVIIILLWNVGRFLIDNFTLQNDITCHESIPEAKVLSIIQFLMALPATILLYTIGLHDIPLKFVLSGFIVSVGPLTIYLLIMEYPVMTYYYGLLLDFIQVKYTFVYSSISCILIALPLLGINYILFSTITLLISRSCTFMLEFHSVTIVKLHHTFCCATRGSWRKVKIGSAISGIVLAAANSPAGQQLISFIEGNFLGSF